MGALKCLSPAAKKSKEQKSLFLQDYPCVTLQTITRHKQKRKILHVSPQVYQVRVTNFISIWWENVLNHLCKHLSETSAYCIAHVDTKKPLIKPLMEGAQETPHGGRIPWAVSGLRISFHCCLALGGKERPVSRMTREWKQENTGCCFPAC